MTIHHRMKGGSTVMHVLLLLLCVGYSVRWSALYPHRADCYTQGLSFINSTHMLESCGMYNLSYFHILAYSGGDQDETHSLTQTYVSQIPFAYDVFVEGSVVFRGMIYILTWKEYTVYRIDADSMVIADTLSWAREGWGLTHNHTHLIVSDGSDSLFICDEALNVKDQIAVTHNGRKVQYLNELEWVEEDGQQYVYANVYLATYILKISLSSGKAVRKIDMKHFVRNERNRRSGEVINGIAVNPQTKQVFITGKYWDHFYLLPDFPDQVSPN